MGRSNQKKAHKPSGKLGRRARKRMEGVDRPHRPSVKASAIGKDKLIRKQASAARRQKSREEELRMRRQPGAPVLVGFLPLSQGVDCRSVWNSIVRTCVTSGKDANMEIDDVENCCTLQLPGVRKMKWTLLPVLKDYKDPLALVDFLSTAELLVLVVDGNENAPPIDEAGFSALEIVRAIGASSVVSVVTGMSQTGLKEVSAAKKRAMEVLKHELTADVRVFAVNEDKDSEAMLHHLQPRQTAVPAWRRERPAIMVHNAEMHPGDYPSHSTLCIEGFVRHKRLSANQVVTIPGMGDYQIKRIMAAESPAVLGGDPVKQKGDVEVLDNILAQPKPEVQHPIVRENEPPMTEASEDKVSNMVPEAVPMEVRRLPKGTSEYQASWILDEEDYLNSESDLESAGNENNGPNQNDIDLDDLDNQSVGRASSFQDSDDDSDFEWDVGDEMALDEKQEAEQEDKDYPDEVEVPRDSPARVRFQNYRGLKSFRTSKWDPRENLPEEYSRIFAFEHFRNATKRAKAEVGLSGDGCVAVGQYVSVELDAVETEKAQWLVDKVGKGGKGLGACVVAYALLMHETKMSVVNFRVRKAASYEDPIANKEEVLMVAGIRSFKARPMFSSDDTRNDKHKMEKFLQPETHTFATVYSQITYPAMPVLAFKIPKDGGGPAKLAFTGMLQSCDTDRLVLKKIILTGRVAQVRKKRAIVTGMFYNPDDIRWYKPLELWTKYGRSGFIKEPLGTHGAMKCFFDGSIQQRDTVCVSLYKRVFPVWPRE